MRFPDVEAMILDFLAAHLTAQLYTTVPADRPDRFLRVWRNGGAAANRIIDRPLITVEAWSHDSADASALAEDARDALLHRASEMPLVRGVTEITGPYSMPDPESDTPRYRFSVQLTVRAQR